MFKNNPKTTFINAHLGWLGNDLDRLSKHLDDNPNVITIFILHLIIYFTVITNNHFWHQDC